VPNLPIVISRVGLHQVYRYAKLDDLKPPAVAVYYCISAALARAVLYIRWTLITMLTSLLHTRQCPSITGRLVMSEHEILPRSRVLS